MANEIRLRSNNISGTTTDNPLTNIATTINSPGFVDLPTVGATNHLILILDPLEINGQAEIVQVTAHTAAATSVTVVRGFDNSVARTHILGTTWFHGPVASDVDRVIDPVLATNRPVTNLIEGRVIYETDSNKLMGYTGTDWAPRDAGGQLGYAQAVTFQAGVTVITDVTGVTTTVTVAAGRRVKVTGYCAVQQLGGAGLPILYIQQDGVTVQRAFITTALSDFVSLTAGVALSPSTGSHTYKLRIEAVGNSLTTISDAVTPAYILVEDIGAA